MAGWHSPSVKAGQVCGRPDITICGKHVLLPRDAPCAKFHAYWHCNQNQYDPYEIEAANQREDHTWRIVDTPSALWFGDRMPNVIGEHATRFRNLRASSRHIQATVCWHHCIV
eukprot:5831663-Amphidinium_carterae.1